MTTLARIAIALLVALFASSCNFDVNFGSGKKGNGDVVEEKRSVSEDFEVVSASEGLDVFVTQDKDFSISVEADENVIDLIATDIKDGKLRIHTLENIGRATKNVYVTLPQIDALKSSSGADLIVQNVVSSESIELDASSGSDLQVELVATQVSADASSGADIRVSGEAKTLIADASSGADIRAKALQVEDCNAEASSGADINVNVSKTLVANASSGADISYTGEASVQKRKSSSGSVHKY
ncbi:MAG: head GIN domain-containing protein [Bacteroidota bacterium]